MALSSHTKQWSAHLIDSADYPHKGGREQDQDWCTLWSLTYNGEDFGKISLFGDGHGNNFNLGIGLIHRFEQIIHQYDEDIFTVEQGSLFVNSIWRLLQQHLFNGTITNDERGYDCGGSTVQLCLQCKPISCDGKPFIIVLSNGDSELAFITDKMDECGNKKILSIEPFNWNSNGTYNQYTKKWSTCKCETGCHGCYIKNRLIQILGLYSCSKIHRRDASPQENRFNMHFGSWSPCETIGYEAEKPYELTTDQWNKIQQLFSEPQVQIFDDPNCHTWSIFQCSDGPFSHCAMPNLECPDMPSDVSHIIKFLNVDYPITFTQFATDSLNNVSHKFILKHFKISSEELKEYSPQDLLHMFMQFYEANHNPKGIDDDWIEALREAAEFVKQYDSVYTPDMSMNEKIKWLQCVLTLCYSDDNCLIMFTQGFD
jgi:hypothetical protein